MSSTPWVARTSPHARLRLFCFPYAGGGSSLFRLWPQQLPPELDVCPVLLPGRETRWHEPLFTHLPSLVQALAEGLYPVLDVPFAFFGHSLGALIGFELARRLARSRRAAPTHLFVAAHRAPQLPLPASPLHILPDPEFINALYRLGGTPVAILQNEEMMRLMLPILRADFTLYETYTYTPEEPLACPVTAFGGEQDRLVSMQELAGWREQTTSFFTMTIIPGDHFFLHSHQSLVLQAIRQALLL
jgi:medium-chain acyl-[acyl-carrier-protein] hydrolase